MSGRAAPWVLGENRTRGNLPALCDARMCKFFVTHRDAIDPGGAIAEIFMMKSHDRPMGVWLVGITLALSAMVSGQMPATRERMQKAVQVSRDLADAAEPEEKREGEEQAQPNKAEEKRERFPQQSHVIAYAGARSWAMRYTRYFRGTAQKEDGRWPVAEDGVELRRLLKEGDPAIRGMAAEALATLGQSENVPLPGDMLDDAAEAAPELVDRFSSQPLMVFGGNLPARKEALVFSLAWQKATVAAYARKGLKRVTGRQFADKAAFLTWWSSNANARHCLWYWQQRIQREMDEAEARAGIGLDPHEQRKQCAAVKLALSRAILAELKQLPPEVEAKVRLLTTSAHAGGAPITGTEDSFWPEPPSLRVKPDRLLDLLDRKGLWDDVPWDVEHYNLLAERMGLWAQVLFRPEHVGRLRQVGKRERDNLWWSGQASLVIGISRLLPPAKKGQLDDVNTREGMLRNAVLHEPDLFARDYCAMELVKVGLPENADFLKRVAFAPGNEDGSPTMMQAILQELGRSPLSVEKRELLADIVLDERFVKSWTRQLGRMGDDMDRQHACWSINAHAGRELIGDDLKQALVDPARSAKALEKIRAIVAPMAKTY